jgi:hypothetical protein
MTVQQANRTRRVLAVSESERDHLRGPAAAQVTPAEYGR